MGGRIHAALKVVECPVLATSGPSVARNRSPLYPQERTFRGPRWTSGFDATHDRSWLNLPVPAMSPLSLLFVLVVDGLAHGSIYPHCGIVLHARDDMGVNIERRLDR